MVVRLRLARSAALTAGSLALALVVAACGDPGGGPEMPPPDGPVTPTGMITFGALVDGAVIGGPQHTTATIDASMDVVRVELYLDGNRIGEAPFAPWTIDWTTLPFTERKSSLRAVAYLIDGARVESAIQVQIDNTPPQVGVAGQPKTGGTLVIDATDNTGVDHVDAKIDGVATTAQRTATGFEIPWSRACGGPTTIELVAYDRAGWHGTASTTVMTFDDRDQDCDGHRAIAAGGDDCNDQNASTYPGTYDYFGDGVDNNCDGADGIDYDHDGFADTASGGTDCNDGDATIHPAPLTWGAKPLIDGAGQTITWTRGNAAIVYDPTSQASQLAIVHGGAVDLVTIAASGAVTRTSLATGADDGPLALAMSSSQYVLAYAKGKALHVRRWTRGNDPTAGVVDDVAFTAADPVTTPSLAIATDAILVAAQTQSTIWAGRLSGSTWTSGAVVTKGSPGAGPLWLGADSTLAYSDTSYLKSGPITWSATPTFTPSWNGYTYYGVAIALFPFASNWYYGAGYYFEVHYPDFYSYNDVYYAATTVGIVFDGGSHALLMAVDAAGKRIASRVNLTTLHAAPLDATLGDGDVAAPIDTLGHWIVAAPGTYFTVTGGTLDPIDGVDRNCDGED
jgi:Putative metal-binding motif/Bacterial Ig domain